MTTLCKEMCWHYIGYQFTTPCTRPAKKDGYCTQHHPDSVKKREAKAHAKWKIKRGKEMLMAEKHAIRFLEGRGYSVTTNTVTIDAD